ncbi:uncharacterized protein [Nicotiana tomentosiformis]|uniref:uncharacterized protein n=1 Tax=Nicotiana tomentosiformis TaxID=4098 RepID=UPI00388CB925
MGPRKAVDVVTENQIPDLQEQYEDLAAHHTEMIQMVITLKNSIDGVQLHQQSRESASTSNNRDQGAQMRQGILGPNPYCTNFNDRGHNLLFPLFNGKNLKTWLYRAEQYFTVDNTPNNLKVDLVAMNLDDVALVWHQSYLKCRDSVIPPNWEEYLAALVEIFSEEFAYPIQDISCFLGGLKEELVNPVKMHEPQTLSKTYRLARLAEETLAANFRAHKHYPSDGSPLPVRKPTYEPPAHKPSHLIPTSMPKLALPAPITTNIPRTRRTISPAEMQARRAKGFCYFCDEKCTPGNTPMISLCALNGLQDAQTNHVNGYSDRRPIKILLDGRITHNFINEESAKRLGCTVHPTNVGYVSMGNNTLEATSGVVWNFEWILQGTTFTSDLIVFPVGKYDLVLGALWMKTVGLVTMDYSELTMAFHYQGKFHLLKGVTDEYKVLNSKGIGKLEGDEVQLFILHMVTSQHTSTNNSQLNAVHLANEHNIPAPIEHLLRRYSQIFAKPTSLPPVRGQFDHQIPLQLGAKTVNIRPYRYSVMKKDIIAKIVQEMLPQGIIQYSNNTFSSHVVFVGKEYVVEAICKLQGVESVYYRRQISYINHR